MESFPACPQCHSALTYDDGTMFVCPECSHEWGRGGTAEHTDGVPTVCDAYGNVLHDGDTVTLIKNLKVKGASDMKVGTKVKNIRLVDGDHNIDCKVDGIGAMQLKSEFVKKA